MKTFIPLTFLALVLSPLAIAHCPAHQIADAQTKAATEKKDVLLVFIGGDWDAASENVKAKALNDEAFKKETSKHFVTHVMEFAKDPKDSDKGLLALRERYKVNRLPAIIQTDSLGRPYGFANFRGPGNEAVLKSLKANVETREKRDAAFAKAQKLKGLEKAKSMIEGLELLPQFILRDFYANELVMIADADPKGETGFVAKIEKAEKLDQEQKRYQVLFKGEKFDQVVKLSQNESAALKGEDAQRVAMYGIQALASLKKYDEAKKAIDAMAKLDPETEFGKSAERYNGVVDRIKARNEQQAAAAKAGLPKKKARGPIVSKPVAVVTDIKKLREESKEIDAEAKKAQEVAEKAAKAQKEFDQQVSKLTKEIEALQKGNKKRSEAAKKAKENADKLAKKSKMMKEVIENHEAMEKRKRDISELEKKAAELQKQAEALRKKSGEIKKGR
ncbi:hypothetical protein N9162_00915 [bacterium]|nr:hypothetical protein [bacterium]MDB4562339.1 hypothetical protein [Akkermansiaceae bacterium]